MSITLRHWSTLVATLLASCSTLAQPASEVPSRVISINLASVDPAGSYELTPDANELGVSSANSELDYASGEGATLAWGIEDGNGRVMLEYYYSDINVDNAPFTVGSDTPSTQTHALFYSGYWVPDIYWGIKGILGAGIGYAEQSLKNAEPDELSERGWGYKFSGGLEFAVMKNLSVYALAEKLYLDDVNDYVEIPGTDDPATVSARRALNDNDQLRLALGINFRY